MAKLVDVGDKIKIDKLERVPILNLGHRSKNIFVDLHSLAPQSETKVTDVFLQRAKIIQSRPKANLCKAFWMLRVLEFFVRVISVL